MSPNENTDTDVLTDRASKGQFKARLRALVIEFSRLPLISAVLQAPSVHNTLHTVPGFRSFYDSGWDRVHPFDRSHGTDTSGFVASEDLAVSEHSSDRSFVYGGSQPGVVRSALATLPSPETFTFVDLGTGKGRPLLVASEFPFRDIIGIELSPSLAGIAQKNAAIMEKRFPGRTRVRVEQGDAGAFRFPPGNIVLFLYHPFGEEIVARVVAGLEAALAAGRITIFVVYNNPYHASCFDASPAFKRYFAANIPYAREERAYGPVGNGGVVIWQGGVPLAPPMPGADARIIRTADQVAEVAA
jgi:hypothetical protein